MCWNALIFSMIIAHCEKGCKCGEALRHFLNLIDESVSAFSSQIRTCGPLCFGSNLTRAWLIHVDPGSFSDRVSSDVSVFQVPSTTKLIHSLQVDAHDYGDRPQNLSGHPAMRVRCRDVVHGQKPLAMVKRWIPYRSIAMLCFFLSSNHFHPHTMF